MLYVTDEPSANVTVKSRYFPSTYFGDHIANLPLSIYLSIADHSSAVPAKFTVSALPSAAQSIFVTDAVKSISVNSEQVEKAESPIVLTEFIVTLPSEVQ